MSAKTRALYSLVPVVAAIIVYANTFESGFSTEETQVLKLSAERKDFSTWRAHLDHLLEKGDYVELAKRFLDPGGFLVSDYRERPEAHYRPLQRLSLVLNASAGAGPTLPQVEQMKRRAAACRAVNVALNALSALLAFFVLLKLCGDPVLACLGATIFAVLPVRSDAVSSLAGRADVMASVAVLGAWLVALRGNGKGIGAPLAAGVIVFFGSLFSEDVIVVLPVVLAGSWLLGKPLPRLTVGAMASAAAGYLMISYVVLGSSPAEPSFIQNPLHYTGTGFSGTATRLANAISLLVLYATRIVVPIWLSADYSFNAISVFPGDDERTWVMAAGVLTPLIFVSVYFRRKAPLISLAVVFFLAAIAANANILFTIETIFAERAAATASFGLPILLCGLARTQPLARHRELFLAALALLAILYGARTWARNGYWAEPDKMDLRLSEHAPDSTWSHFKTAAWYVEQQIKASGEEKKKLLETAMVHVTRSLQIHPGNGRAEQLAGVILMKEHKYAEAAAHFFNAGRHLAEETPPVAEPDIFRFRGECYVLLKRFDKAIEDFKTYVILLRTLGQAGDTEAILLARAQDLTFYKFRGLAFAGSGKLAEALSDFEAAVRHLPELPESWNNRGFCRFQLKDLKGALEDYEWGLELCREKRIFYAPPPTDSVWSFSRRIADVHEEVARVEHEAGNEAAALEAETEAGKWKAEADRLAPPPAEATPPR